MGIVVDASAVLAVIMGEPERERIVEAVTEHVLIGPGSLPWEIGNAFSAMLKQRWIGLEEARRGLAVFQSIPLRYVDVEVDAALSIAHRMNLYAHDAYFVECAARYAAPLLTLDTGLRHAARRFGVRLIEV